MGARKRQRGACLIMLGAGGKGIERIRWCRKSNNDVARSDETTFLVSRCFVTLV